MKSSGQLRKPRLFAVRRVVGDSMLPVLKAGTLVVAVPGPIKVGKVVIAQYAGREVIKRVSEISPKGVFLRGDNSAASTDSRMYGLINSSDVYGVVVWPFGLSRR